MATAFHGTALFFTFKRTYDAYVHIFFADHYRRAWFDHWEPRWYTGFPINSYPPGTHQLTALISESVGLQNAFIAVQMTGVLLLVVGIYRFSRIWVSPRASEMAAMAMVFSTSLCETVHVFGQLPTTVSLGILLNGLAYGNSWLRSGSVRHLLVALALGAATTACHHVTTLFGGVFFVAPVVLKVVTDQCMTKEGRQPRALSHLLMRIGIYGVGLIGLLVLVVFPYWVWSISDPITQVSIPHASRDSFVTNLNAGLVFWVIPHGLTLLFLPHVIKRSRTVLWPLCGSYWALFVLGTGGTTAIPKFLLRGAFDILTLDRFTIWASVIVLPLVGEALVHQKEDFKKKALPLLGLAAVIASVYTINLTQFRSFQPKHIDIAPIVDFLESDGHDNWRYLALGFGDQMAWLSANTKATTVDGNYHSARRLPELTTTSIERLEGAKYRGEDGLKSLKRFITAPHKYNLKFVFSNDEFYDPLLFFSGFQRMARLSNGVVLWEKPDVPMLTRETKRKEIPLVFRLMWGLLPLSAIGFALLAVWHWGRIELPNAPEVKGSPSLLPPACALLGLSLALGFWLMDTRKSPEATVERYLGHLDFRREHEAWELLVPTSRPNFESFHLKRSVTNGLLASYAKLTSVECELVGQEGDKATVRALMSFLTPLGMKRRTQEFELYELESSWKIVPRLPVQAPPADRLWKSAAVTWQTRGRKVVGEGTTDFDDLMDRPEFRLLSASARELEDAVEVVGELESTDSDPAALTITAYLYKDGVVVASRNHTVGLHLLAPGEWTPFKVEIRDLPESFDGVELRCQTLVSNSVPASPLSIDQRAGQLYLSNRGGREATVPMFIEVTRDRVGKVVSVDENMIFDAVRPGRELVLPKREGTGRPEGRRLPLVSYPKISAAQSSPKPPWKVSSFARTADLD